MVGVERITKGFGGLTVYEDFSLEFPSQQISVVLGPSGCGKTTLLNLLAGLIQPDQGRVNRLTEVSYVFQEPRLLPWLTIRQNLLLVLRQKLPVDEANSRIDRLLDKAGLSGCADYLPPKLSGGMRQRAAMVRAFSYPASLLLMDEPFKSIDLKTRYQMTRDFLALWRSNPHTVVMVTHDLWEALWLGDRITVLGGRPARIVEEIPVAVPQEERLGHPDLVGLEKDLYQLVLED